VPQFEIAATLFRRRHPERSRSSGGAKSLSWAKSKESPWSHC